MFDAKSPPQYAEQLGARLRALRLQRNITQARLAEQAGISRPTLAALEQHGRASLLTLAHLAYALGREGELESLLQPDPPSTLVEATGAARRRQRARS